MVLGQFSPFLKGNCGYWTHLSPFLSTRHHSYSRKQIVQAHRTQEGYSKSEKQFAELLTASGCFEHFQVCICSGLGDSQRRHRNAIEVQTTMKVTVEIKARCLFGSNILRSKGIVLKRSLQKRIARFLWVSSSMCATLRWGDASLSPSPQEHDLQEFFLTACNKNSLWKKSISGDVYRLLTLLFPSNTTRDAEHSFSWPICSWQTKSKFPWVQQSIFNTL